MASSLSLSNLSLIHISRQETAVLLQSFARYMGIDLPKIHEAAIFADDAAITGWARDAVRDMQMAGVMSGRADGSFIPQGTLTLSLIHILFIAHTQGILPRALAPLPEAAALLDQE